MSEKLNGSEGSFLVEVGLASGVSHRALLTGGLLGQFFQDVSLLKILNEDNTTKTADFEGVDIETVTFTDNDKYDSKSLIGMMPYQVTLKSGKTFILECFQMKKSRWLVGMTKGVQGIKKTFVNFESISKIKKLSVDDHVDIGQAVPEPVSGKATTIIPSEKLQDADATPPQITPFNSQLTPSTEGERFQPILEYIKKHDVIDYQNLSVFMKIKPGSLRHKIRLGDFLVQEGLISLENLEEALAFQKNNRKLWLGKILIELGYLSEFLLALALAVQFRLPFTILNPDNVDKEAAKLFSIEQAYEHEAIPFKLAKNQLSIAVANPNLKDVQELSFIFNKNIALVITRAQDVQQTIAQIYGKQERTGSSAHQDQEIQLDEVSTFDEGNVDAIIAKGQEAPIVALVNQIIIEGVGRKASDIHIIPEKKFIRVGYRINGIIHEKNNLNKNVQSYLVARIKILCGMNIVERRLPQDGRIHGRAMDQTVDIRVSVLPSHHGETVVLRLRYPDKQLPDLVDLGFSKEHLHLIQQGITRSKGMILVTGPTGSGKSTTLISFLKAVLDLPGKLHVITVEDPVELEVEGLTQIPINAAIGMTFPRVLRNILRHDPDVIMVGEIRDQETAKVAVQASLTGHLVFSTLHTNDAISTLARLEDMGIEPFLVGTTVNMVIAQRLVKTLCDCAESYLPESVDQKMFAGFGIPLEPGHRLRRPKGCPKCDHTGYNGRTMAYEFLELDKELRGLDFKALSQAGTLRKVLKEKGFVSLIDHGLSMVVAGKVALAEIMQHWEG